MDKGLNDGNNNEQGYNNSNNEGGANYKTDSTLGGWFGYFGDKINKIQIQITNFDANAFWININEDRTQYYIRRKLFSLCHLERVFLK